MPAAGFMFYASFWSALKTVQPDIRCTVYDALCEYAIEGKKPKLVGLPYTIFELIRPVLDTNIARRENGKLGAGSGKKGGHPKKSTGDKPAKDKPAGHIPAEDKNPCGVISKNPAGDNYNNLCALYDKDKDKDRDKEKDTDKDEDDDSRRTPTNGVVCGSVKPSVVVEREAEIIMKGYAERCPSLMPLKGGLTCKRRAAIDELLKRYQPDTVLGAFDLAEKNAFLRGGGKKGWVASFDWLIDANHTDDLLTGKYDERPRQSGTAAPCGDGYISGSFDLDEFFELAVKRGKEKGKVKANGQAG